MNSTGRIKKTAKLLSYVGEMKWYMALNCLIGLLYRCTPMIIGFLTSYMVGSVISGSNENLIGYFVCIIVFVIVRSLLSYGDMWISHDIAYKILYKFRFEIYDRLEKSIPSFGSKMSSGEMVSIANGDVTILEWFYAHTMNTAIITAVCIVGILISLFKIHYMISLVTAIWILFLMILPILFRNRSHKDGKRVRSAFGRVNAFLTDYIQGMRELISFQSEKNFRKKFDESLNNYEKAAKINGNRIGSELGLSTLFTCLSMVSILILSFYLVGKGKLNIKWVPVTLTLSSGVFLPFMEFMAMARQFSTIYASADRVFELLNVPINVEDNGKVEIDKDIDEIVFEDVTYTYPDSEKPAVKNLSFTMKKGQLTALSGESGAGKSTIIHLLQRYCDPDNGRILVDGVDIKEIKLSSWREALAVVTQNTYLFNGTIGENIEMGRPGASVEEIKNVAKISQADKFIREMPEKYNTPVGERATKISGGQKQRISIARALLKNSQIVVFDEASSSLDTENEESLNRELAHIRKDSIMITIAHRLSTISQSDKVIFLDDGQIIDIGNYDKLRENNKLFMSKVVGNGGTSIE